MWKSEPFDDLTTMVQGSQRLTDRALRSPTSLALSFKDFKRVSLRIRGDEKPGVDAFNLASIYCIKVYFEKAVEDLISL